MFGLLKSVLGLAADVMQVVAAPVEIIAGVAKDLVADVKSLKD